MSETKSNTSALVEVVDVEKVFHRGSEDIHVLNDLNVQVPAGEFLALMGPSGSGKSTRRPGSSDQRHGQRGGRAH
jgi:putative ABC transport system ATP-binding protein